MILKVFTKKCKGGKPIETGLEWQDGYYESNDIKKKKTEEGFEFYVTGCEGEPDFLVCVNTSRRGFEILNSQGITIEKYITPIRDEMLENPFAEEEALFEGHTPSPGIVSEEEIISNALIVQMIENARTNHIRTPYELVISDLRLVHEDWITGVLTRSNDIQKVTRAKDMKLNTTLLRHLQQ